MSNYEKYILSYATQLIYETVNNGKQGIEIIEGGESLFIEGTLKRLIAANEAYYVTNLAVAKRIAKDILGTVHGAPYIFMDMVWVPLETYNRNVMMYVALHHIERIISISNKETILELKYGVKVQLNLSRNSVYKRLFVACFIKLLLDLKKKYIHENLNQHYKQCEIIKDEGNVYYTKKDLEENYEQ